MRSSSCSGARFLRWEKLNSTGEFGQNTYFYVKNSFVMATKHLIPSNSPGEYFRISGIGLEVIISVNFLSKWMP